MHDLTINELHNLMQTGNKAKAYAWDHYDDLVARQHTYTLYGPTSYGISASLPGNIVPKSSRQLTKKTRRRDYTIYELNDEYQVLRTIAILNYTEIDCIYHHFELDGVTYAVPFRGKGKEKYGSASFALQFEGNKPVYCGSIRSNSIIAEFFEYIADSKLIVTSYGYCPTAMRSRHGYPIDFNAPIGALNSCADKGVSEETDNYIEFSRWFR